MKKIFPTIQAILESEPFSITLKTVGKAKLLGEQFAKEVGCSDLDCLYKKVPQLNAVHHHTLGCRRN